MFQEMKKRSPRFLLVLLLLLALAGCGGKDGTEGETPAEQEGAAVTEQYQESALNGETGEVQPGEAAQIEQDPDTAPGLSGEEVGGTPAEEQNPDAWTEEAQPSTGLVGIEDAPSEEAGEDFSTLSGARRVTPSVPEPEIQTAWGEPGTETPPAETWTSEAETWIPEVEAAQEEQLPQELEEQPPQDMMGALN